MESERYDQSWLRPIEPCALASAELVRGVERHTELSVCMGSLSMQLECSTDRV